MYGRDQQFAHCLEPSLMGGRDEGLQRLPQVKGNLVIFAKGIACPGKDTVRSFCKNHISRIGFIKDQKWCKKIAGRLLN